MSASLHISHSPSPPHKSRTLAHACLSSPDMKTWRALASGALRSLERGDEANSPSREGETALVLAEASARMGNPGMAESALQLGAYLAPELIRLVRMNGGQSQLSERRSLLCAPDSYLTAAARDPNVETLVNERLALRKAPGAVVSLHGEAPNRFMREALLRAVGINQDTD